MKSDMGKQVFWILLLPFLVVGVNGKATNDRNKLLVLLIDGFRWDYFDRFDEGELPGFEKWKQEGVKADYLTSVFVTLSFPNFYSLMTGWWVGIISSL
jgi:ectonucleotide pyrophosphatase/phosphodiesterase family protein 6